MPAAQNEPNDIPVYLFTGFLEAGKTKFIQETMEDKRFNSGEPTLLLLCEEGEEEYDVSAFPCKDVFLHTIEDQEDFNPENLQKIPQVLWGDPCRSGIQRYVAHEPPVPESAG